MAVFEFLHTLDTKLPLKARWKYSIFGHVLSVEANSTNASFNHDSGHAEDWQTLPRFTVALINAGCVAGLSAFARICSPR